jgi:hypothetical protein
MSSSDKEYLRSDEEISKKMESLAAKRINSLPEDCLPTPEYLEKYVLPYVEPAMKAVALKRPNNPI